MDWHSAMSAGTPLRCTILSIIPKKLLKLLVCDHAVTYVTADPKATMPEERCLAQPQHWQMMMILLLFLQKQNLAFAVYLLGSVLSLPD